jgi:hypothetical protein
LAEMNPVGRDREGHIDMVVYEEKDAVATGDGKQRDGFFVIAVFGKTLGAKLDGVGSSVERRIEKTGKILATDEAFIDDYV